MVPFIECPITVTFSGDSILNVGQMTHDIRFGP
jgi:hypothetical protein